MHKPMWNPPQSQTLTGAVFCPMFSTLICMTCICWMKRPCILWFRHRNTYLEQELDKAQLVCRHNNTSSVAHGGNWQLQLCFFIPLQPHVHGHHTSYGVITHTRNPKCASALMPACVSLYHCGTHLCEDSHARWHMLINYRHLVEHPLYPNACGMSICLLF